MKKYQQEYANMLVLMGQESQNSAVEKIVILVHTINKVNALSCISNNQQCQFPIDWKKFKEQSYGFMYENDRNGAVLEFKITLKEGNISVLFNQIGSKQLYRVGLKLDENQEQIAKKYEFNLLQYIKQSQKSSNQPQRRQRVQPISPPMQRQPIQFNHLSNNIGSYPPKDLINPNIVSNPFGQEQYVGPNSTLFDNQYQSQRIQPNSMRIPPGARYDPVDPFDSPLIDKNQPRDFFGFDEFGRPLKAPFGNKSRNNPNPFGNGPFGGFGGGFGGGFNGGFGGMI